MSKDPTDQKEIVPRVGTFLILLGLFSFILFLASDFADQPDFDWLFASILFVAIGYGFRRRATPPPPSGRFSILRRMRKKSKQDKEEKAKKQG